MSTRVSLRAQRLRLPGVAALLLCLGARAEAGDVPDFNCFLRPLQDCSLLIGDIVQVHFEVDSTAVQFNGYEVTLQYDPDVLEFLGISEGSLMTSACGTRFQNITTTDSTVTLSHVILCGGVSIDGPGRLSSFRFEGIAEGETEVQIVSNPDRLFVDAGLWIWAGHSSFPRQVVFLDDGTTTLCVSDPGTSGVGDWVENVSRGPEMDLRLLPNPARDVVRVRLGAPSHAPIVVDIVSADGRRVGPARTIAAGSQELALPLTDLVGASLPAGSYFVRARTPNGAEVAQKLVVVR